MPTSVGLAVIAGVVLMGCAMSAHNSGRMPLAILLGLAALGAVGLGVLDWVFFLEPR